MMKQRRGRSLVSLVPLFLFAASAVGDEPDTALLTIERIYANKEFDAEPFSGRWLDDESGFTTLEPSSEHEDRHDIVRHDAKTGETEVIVAAGELIPRGESTPLEIDDYAWSQDQALLLIYTNSQRVWREKTRGDHWLLDRAGRRLTQLGGEGRPTSMMFAELSPTGDHVAFVRDRNIYVEDLYDHTIRRLTTADTENVINGTTDWSYEEEFRVRPCDPTRFAHDSAT
jgi:dipeptidyl-peptidase-4